MAERIEYSEKQNCFHLVSMNHPYPPEKNSNGFIFIAENIDYMIANAFCLVIENNYLHKNIKISAKEVQKHFEMLSFYLDAFKTYGIIVITP